MHEEMKVKSPGAAYNRVRLINGILRYSNMYSSVSERRLDTFVRHESPSPVTRSPVTPVLKVSSSSTDNSETGSPCLRERTASPKTCQHYTTSTEQTASPQQENKDGPTWGKIEILSQPQLSCKEEKQEFKEKYREDDVDPEAEPVEETCLEIAGGDQPPASEYIVSVASL